MICDKCGKEFNGKAAGAHKRWCRPEAKGLTTKSRVEIKKDCLNCGTVFTAKSSPPSLWHLKSAYKGSNCCSMSCQVQHTMTDDVKAKISKSRKKFLKENPDKHPWKKADKFISKPCEELKRILTDQGFVYESEWLPIESHSYSIDIAFPDLKIGIEVNGNQHYTRDNKLRPYYRQRHDRIESEGWTLVEMHYANVYKQEELDKLIDALKTHKADEIQFTKVRRPPPKEEIKAILREKAKQRTVYRQKLRDETNAKRLAYLQTVDLKSWGWVQKVANEFNVSHTHAKRIVNKLMPGYDYYIRQTPKNIK